MIWPDPTHQPTHPTTHPPNYTPTHGWGSLHRFQIFKQNWNISISSSAIEFWLIPGVPPWGWGGWADMSGGWWGGAPYKHTHACMHMCMHAHARTHTYDIIGNSQGFPKNPMEAAICMKLSCLPHVRVRACACVHVRACVCVCGAPPNHPPPPSTHPPHPQSRREPENTKIQ